MPEVKGGRFLQGMSVAAAKGFPSDQGVRYHPWARNLGNGSKQQCLFGSHAEDEQGLVHGRQKINELNVLEKWSLEGEVHAKP